MNFIILCGHKNSKIKVRNNVQVILLKFKMALCIIYKFYSTRCQYLCYLDLRFEYLYPSDSLPKIHWFGKY